MKINIIPPYKALSKAYLKQNVNRADIEIFKSNLKTLFDKAQQAQIKGEHEEHFKNIVSDFLKNTYYKDLFEINTGKRKDLVIHNGNSSSHTIGVIIEAKKPDNSAEMISAQSLNVKAFWELILYYFDEREANKNIEIKHLVANNAFDWFIFDENEFDKLIYRNPKFIKLYKTKTENSKDNPFFYAEAQKIIAELSEEISCIYFNLKDFETLAFNNNSADDEQLIDLYKILSPEHLLKKPFANDSNSLNKNFYNELLHIIGLEEKPEGGKKLIIRKAPEKRDEGSLLENTIDVIARKKELSGTVAVNEHDYSIALELCITWLNRVLFLKLLEGQLIKYHNGNQEYLFLNNKSIKDFDELEELFFDVLAKKLENRTKSVNQKFGNIPYLNSSLFDATEFEKNFVYISNLKNRFELPLLSHSVLKNKDEFKNTKNLNTLQYLFEFLGAYNFSSDTSAKIQEDNKSIINASVLGLIFEKINGYKDGSFFTPGFITMYMCRETIRRAVAQKFKELENKEIDTFDDAKNYCSRYFKKDDILRFNKHINSLKICDPAVGSGHFLVSALNEIIAIKSELNILADSEGLPLDYEVSVDNDELVIVNKRSNRPFEYLLGSDNLPPKQLQTVQEALFTEKQTIIENCLFGVDINPKSVLICRLRLWIELLKNAYYIVPPVGTGRDLSLPELQTLPNIDINIKCGNSLISRFDINDKASSLIPAMRQKMKLATNKYKEQVFIYKSTTDRQTKHNTEKEIARLKEQFSQIANPTDKDFVELKKLRAEIGQMPMFFNREEQEDWKKQLEIKTERLAKMEADYEIKQKTLYSNAFEWRFEFPEVLDENGDFEGFDVVVGNPPYGTKLEEFEKSYFILNYKNQDYQFDTYLLFIENIFRIMKQDSEFSFIIPNTWLTNIKYRKIRKFIIQNTFISEISHYKKAVFEQAVVDTETLFFKKCNSLNDKIKIKYYETKMSNNIHFASQTNWLNSNGNTINILMNEAENVLKQKIEKGNKPMGELFNVVIGVKPYQVGKGKPKQTREIVTNRIFDAESKIDLMYKKLLRGSDILKFTNKWDGKRWIKYGEHLAEPRASANFDKEKIVVRQTGDTLIATFDTDKFICMNNLHVITQIETNKLSLKYLLALVNSKLMDFYHFLLNPEKGEALAEVKKENLEKLPIKEISAKEQKPFIKLVEKILTQKKENPQSDTKELEREIDTMVYKLYELSEEEIRIVEGNGKTA